MPLETIYIVLLFLVAGVGWLTILFGLPGTVVIFLSALAYAWPADFEEQSDVKVLVILGIAAFVAEGSEQLLFFARSKKAKVPTRVILSAIVGGIIGALIGFPVPILGNILGFFVGIFAGGFLSAYYQTKNFWGALKMAKDLFLSHALAISFKAFLGLMMILYLIFKV